MGARIALLPAWIAVLCYVFSVGWTTVMSFTTSKVLPSYNFAGLDQYVRLLANERWLVSIANLCILAVLVIVGTLLIGTLLAILLERGLPCEGLYRTVFLMPFSLSFMVTGIAWQWILDPGLGLQQAVRNLGLSGFVFDWIIRPERAIYVVAIAGIWQGAGLVMALMLAGLRGIDPDIWKAARVEGIPAYRTYLQIVLPMLTPTILTAVIFVSVSVLRSYDLIVAMTKGGPGFSTEVPAKFIVDYLFSRQKIGLATAAAVTLLAITLILILPLNALRRRRAPANR